MSKFITALAALLLLATICLAVYFDYQIDKQIEGWKVRAQVSSEPNDMYEYMSNVKVGMENWGMTDGYAALVFKTPENDMSLIYKTVERHVDQAKVLTEMNRSTPEYQTGLDNLRGSIRELNLHTHDYWYRHDGIWLIIIGTLSIIVTLVGLVWWGIEDRW